ncbi:hypothetical protein [Phaffia rhodozyma]|uniref:Clp1-like protein n=1 Tax=Phaffia rhodozyma TaxID=264483 RepID=A0A0F7SS48_PHARH|nr:hypothetical protein [Phaffia rhodozyma]
MSMLPRTPITLSSPASPSRQPSSSRSSKMRPRSRMSGSSARQAILTPTSISSSKNELRRSNRTPSPKRSKVSEASARHSTTRQVNSLNDSTLPHPGGGFLPLYLPRPDRPANIDIGAIKGLDPEVPLDYLLEKLSERGPELLRTALSCSLSDRRIVQSPLPSIMTFDIPPNVTSDVLPTHMLAIRPTAIPSNDLATPTGTLLPVHAIIYQASCAHVPPFPSFEYLPVDQLPVVSIALPSPNQFPLINNFLYTQRPDDLLEKLLNVLEPTRPSGRTGLMNDMANRLGKNDLMDRIAVIHGTWENMCALGIADSALWRTMDIAWEILVGSLALLESKQKLSSSSSSSSPPPPPVALLPMTTTALSS